MIPLIPLLALLPPTDATPAWARPLLHAPAVARPAPSGAHPPAVSPGKGTQDENPCPYPIDNSVDEALLGRIHARLRRGDYEGAYAEAERAWELRPWDLGSYSHELVSAALFTGRYREAERYSEALLSQPGHEWEPNYLRLSLAIALQGGQRPGQAEYASDALQQATRGPVQTWVGDLWFLSRSPATPEDTATANIVALILQEGDTEFGAAYCRWALSRDPKCDVATRGLVVMAVAENRVGDARALAESMVRSLPDGPSRDFYQEELRLMREPARAAKKRIKAQSP